MVREVVCYKQLWLVDENVLVYFVYDSMCTLLLIVSLCMVCVKASCRTKGRLVCARGTKEKVRCLVPPPCLSLQTTQSFLFCLFPGGELVGDVADVPETGEHVVDVE